MHVQRMWYFLTRRVILYIFNNAFDWHWGIDQSVINVSFSNRTFFSKPVFLNHFNFRRQLFSSQHLFWETKHFEGKKLPLTGVEQRLSFRARFQSKIYRWKNVTKLHRDGQRRFRSIAPGRPIFIDWYTRDTHVRKFR